MALPAIDVQASGPGWMTFTVPVPAAEHFQVRVAGGRWSRDFVGPGPHRFDAAHLWLVGRWPLALRAVDAAGRAGAAEVRGSIDVVRVAPLLNEAVIAQLAAAPVSPDETTDEGCASGPQPLFALLALLALLRRRV